MSTRILVGDVRDRLKDLASESVHCVVTSPPYFGLRDYGCSGQIGLEATPDAYVVEMVAVFREVRRVLRSDGTLWLNLGDSYTGGGGGNYSKSVKQTPHGEHTTNVRNKPEWLRAVGLAAKQRLMIPARVALALQADGWWLRDEIIWHKPNPMPVSVTDRTTPAHEMLYMFSKSARYHYDMEAIKEPAVCGARGSKFNTGKTGERQLGRAQKVRGPGNWGVTQSGIPGENENRGRSSDVAGGRETRQPRSVWSIATRPFKGAHFATFPPDLIRPCILAGCPAGGTVLDPFFGAGTTGLVAAELGRSCVGIELNPEYAEIASARLGLVNDPLDAMLKRYRAQRAALAYLTTCSRDERAA